MGALFNRQEAAKKLGICVATLDAERYAGRLSYIQQRPGGKVLISEEAIREYLERATHAARPQMRNTRDTYRKKRA